MQILSRTSAANMPMSIERNASSFNGNTNTSLPQALKRRRQVETEGCGRPSKLSRFSSSGMKCSSEFERLPEDLLLTIFSSLSSAASSPADLVNVMLVCRTFCATVTHPRVLAKASAASLVVSAGSWSEGAHTFLKQCADAGNSEAAYTLGMIRFYCHSNRLGGTSLMARAAMQSHAAALHSLALIRFNGSGAKREDKDLKAGVAFCVRAAQLGHVDAMREVGHCLQDGYGVAKNVYEGRRLLYEANAREAAAADVLATSCKTCVEAKEHLTACNQLGVHSGTTPSPVSEISTGTPQKIVHPEGGGSTTVQGIPVIPVGCRLIPGVSCALLNDFGCTVTLPKLHSANKFLVDWFENHDLPPGLRLCSHKNCGRPETRRQEFRRCSACGCAKYCSRACQAVDWKVRHKYDCQPVHDWDNRPEYDVEDEDLPVEDDEFPVEDIEIDLPVEDLIET